VLIKSEPHFLFYKLVLKIEQSFLKKHLEIMEAEMSPLSSFLKGILKTTDQGL
jgi:hypothetical protein